MIISKTVVNFQPIFSFGPIKKLHWNICVNPKSDKDDFEFHISSNVKKVREKIELQMKSYMYSSNKSF